VGQAPLPPPGGYPSPDGQDSLSIRLVASMDRHARSQCENPPAGFNPCLPSPSHNAPSGSEWVHEIKHDGYRLIARRDGNRVRLYTRRGLRLVRQVSLDNRGAAVPSGPLHHRGRGSGLGWERRQVGFRQAALPSCPLAAAKPSEQVKITWCSSSTCAKNLEAKGKESCSLKRPKRKNERRD
jgi:hypothetical protein